MLPLITGFTTCVASCLNPSSRQSLDTAILFTVASLGLVSHAATTDGFRAIFLGKNLTTFFHSSPPEVMTFFSCRLLTTPIFPRRLSSVLSKFIHKILFFWSGVIPLEGVTRPPPLVTPLTVLTSLINYCSHCFMFTSFSCYIYLLSIYLFTKTTNCKKIIKTFRPMPFAKLIYSHCL